MRGRGEGVVGRLVGEAEAAEVGYEVEDVVEAVEEGGREGLPDVGFVVVGGFLGGEDFGVIGFWVLRGGCGGLGDLGQWVQ